MEFTLLGDHESITGLASTQICGIIYAGCYNFFCFRQLFYFIISTRNAYREQPEWRETFIFSSLSLLCGSNFVHLVTSTHFRHYIASSLTNTRNPPCIAPCELYILEGGKGRSSFTGLHKNIAIQKRIYRGKALTQIHPCKSNMAKMP